MNLRQYLYERVTRRGVLKHCRFALDRTILPLKQEEYLLRRALSWVIEEQRILSQRKLHNSMLPISKLPTEILANIFTFAYGTSLNQYKVSGSPKIRVKSYPAACVCGFWRNCMLSISDLWSVVQLPWHWQGLVNLQLIEQYVARSKPRAFELRLTINDASIYLFKKWKRTSNVIFTSSRVYIWVYTTRIASRTFSLSPGSCPTSKSCLSNSSKPIQIQVMIFGFKNSFGGSPQRRASFWREKSGRV